LGEPDDQLKKDVEEWKKRLDEEKPETTPKEDDKLHGLYH
jgi:hypothetical protein